MRKVMSQFGWFSRLFIAKIIKESWNWTQFFLEVRVNYLTSSTTSSNYYSRRISSFFQLLDCLFNNFSRPIVSVVSSVSLLMQDAVAIRPAIAKNCKYFCGFLNYDAKVSLLFAIKQVLFKYFLFTLINDFYRNSFEIKVFTKPIFSIISCTETWYTEGGCRRTQKIWLCWVTYLILMYFPFHADRAFQFREHHIILEVVTRRVLFS
jgi:hypothetical protein